jgi:hypothetical protein
LNLANYEEVITDGNTMGQIVFDRQYICASSSLLSVVIALFFV